MFKILNYFRECYWKIFKPIKVGVKILVTNKNSVLLIKNTYGDKWNLPGGGVKKNETLLKAALRELKEECNIEKIRLKSVGTYTNFSEYKNDHIILFTGEYKNRNLKKILKFPNVNSSTLIIYQV